MRLNLGFKKIFERDFYISGNGSNKERNLNLAIVQ